MDKDDRAVRMAQRCHPKSALARLSSQIWRITCIAMAASIAGTAANAANAANCSMLGADNFRAHHDNYVLANRMRNNGWASADDAAFRVQYSFKYSVLGCPAEPRHRSEGFGDVNGSSSEVFLAYTGQFDFYLGTRPSGPVINRVSNPGLHWRLPLKSWMTELADNTSVVLSVEHRSDGQVFEPTLGRGPDIAQQAYDQRDRAFFDTLSRGANFVALHAQGDQRIGGLRLDLQATLRAYLSQDSAITWGPLRNSGYRIQDYDRLWMRAGVDTGDLGYWEFAWRLGDQGLRTDSQTWGWQAPAKWSLPFYVRVHRGPMNTLSNYTQRQDSIGIGLRFTAF